jgi:hypothetical protein
VLKIDKFNILVWCSSLCHSNSSPQINWNFLEWGWSHNLRK